MYRRTRVQRLLGVLAVPAYVIGGVVLMVLLGAVWEHLWGRILVIAAIMILGLLTWWHSWHRMRKDRHDRQTRWGLRK